MLKKGLFFLFILIFISGALFAGCSSTEKTNTVSTTPSVSTIQLSFSSNVPEVVPMSQVYKDWTDKVTQNTGGKVKFSLFYSETLLKDAETFEGVQKGMADFAMYNPNPDSGMHLNLISRLPFVGWSDMTMGASIYASIVNKFPQMKNEYSSMKLYAIAMMPASQMQATKSLIKVPSDVKGKKFSASGELAEFILSVGGAPVEMSVGDWFMSLDKGLIEGVWSSVQAAEAFGCTELLKYKTIFGEGGGYLEPMMTLVNQKKWDSLPPDIQKVFNDLEAGLIKDLIAGEEGYGQYVMGKVKELGQTVVYLTPAETKVWVDAAKPMHEKWIAENAKYGPVQSIYDEIQNQVKQYNAK